MLESVLVDAFDEFDELIKTTLNVADGPGV
jgi:hypothetical protein